MRLASALSSEHEVVVFRHLFDGELVAHLTTQVFCFVVKARSHYHSPFALAVLFPPLGTLLLKKGNEALVMSTSHW